VPIAHDQWNHPNHSVPAEGPDPVRRAVAVHLGWASAIVGIDRAGDPRAVTGGRTGPWSS